jgi:indole-3-acetate monooxygenase
VSLRAGTIQRYYRDMLAASQHVTSSPPILRDCGRDLAGLAQDRVWAFMGLVQPRRG